MPDSATEAAPVADGPEAPAPRDLSGIDTVDPETGDGVDPTDPTEGDPAPDTDHLTTPLVDAAARAEEAAFVSSASGEAGVATAAVPRPDAQAQDASAQPAEAGAGPDHAPAPRPDDSSSTSDEEPHAAPDETTPDAPTPPADGAEPRERASGPDAAAGRDEAPQAEPRPLAAPADEGDAPEEPDDDDGVRPRPGGPAQPAGPEHDRPEEPEGPTFAALGLRPELVEALAGLGYEEPTPIQTESIGPLLDGHDLLGQAATGTGKTAAFALPILQRLRGERRGPAPTALVLVPTRELAIQVSEAVHRYGRPVGARVLPIYGGQPIFRQLRALDAGVDVVVATPGRAIDHIGRGSLVLDSIETVVLDEADEMLDMGFADDIDEILGQAPAERQTVLFSATMPARIEAIARRHLDEAVRIQMGRATTSEGESPLVRQTAYIVNRQHKATALGRILDVESPAAALVFCRTRAEVDQLSETLNGRGYRAEALHGGMDQTQRDRVMGRLRSGTADLLVATDVAARGLDVDQLTHVVNYDVPSAPEAYVHRIGRIGRAGREGVAITLAGPREHRQLKTIERVTGARISIEQVPSAADLRARRLELTRAALHEVLVDDDLDHMRVVVETLTDEFDLMEVALAAVKMAHEATVASGGDDDADIPVVNLRDGRSERGRPTRREDPSGGSDRSATGGRDEPAGRRPGRPSPNRNTGVEMTRLYVSAGRNARVGPGDLVGAIAGETSLNGRDIGSIDIQDGFSLVEVPSDKVDEVIEGLRATTLRGRKVSARRERF